MLSSPHGALGELGNGAQCTSDSLGTPKSEGRAHGNLSYFPFILSISLCDGEAPPLLPHLPPSDGGPMTSEPLRT